MQVALDFDEDTRAFAASVADFCRRNTARLTAEAADPRRLFRDLGSLGALSVGDTDQGGPVAVVAVMEQFGRALFPGPLAAAYLAGALPTVGATQAVLSGEALVCVAVPPLLPWASLATVFIEITAEQAWLCRPVDQAPVETLAGEPWARGRLERGQPLGDPTAGIYFGNLALAGYLVGAAERQLELTAEYAAAREQFGRPIGDFQAVAHPLADCARRLTAARSLCRMAAAPAGEPVHPGRAAAAAVARLSATGAALSTAYQAHQTFGAMGFTVEGPVAGATARIRQHSLLPPDRTTLRELVLRDVGV